MDLNAETYWIFYAQWAAARLASLMHVIEIIVAATVAEGVFAIGIGKFLAGPNRRKPPASPTAFAHPNRAQSSSMNRLRSWLRRIGKTRTTITDRERAVTSYGR